MNKRFLAIAIAAGLAAPFTVMAEGAEIYGIAHAAVVMSSGDDSSDNIEVNSYASRVGVKGSEDLGGGMKAVYKFEYEANITDGGGLTGRNQYVGIQGGMGTVLLGRHDTPTKMVQGKFDVFNDTLADMVKGTTVDEAVIGVDINGNGNTTDVITWGGVEGDVRANNVIAYLSPKMGGMQLIVALVPGEENGNLTANGAGTACGTDICSGIADGVSASFTYEAGPLYVGLGMDSGDLIDDQTRLVATYGMDALTVGFLYNVTDTQASTTDEDETAMGLSASYAMGNNAVKFQYIDISDDAGVLGNDETTMTLGYDMNMTARTTVYGLVRTFDQADVTNIGVGIKHSF